MRKKKRYGLERRFPLINASFILEMSRGVYYFLFCKYILSIITDNNPRKAFTNEGARLPITHTRTHKHALMRVHTNPQWCKIKYKECLCLCYCFSSA